MIGYLLSSFVLGVAMGVAGSVVWGHYAREAAAKARARRRALYDLPPRDAARSGAKGTARIHIAEIRERDPKHGMQM